MGFLTPDKPKASKPAPVPNKSDSEIQAAAASQTSKFYEDTEGRSATLRTGGLGVVGGARFGSARLLGQTRKAA